MGQPGSSTDTQPAHLDDFETRILACLMEKAVLTPRHYPLTMNGLRNACNQKTGRNPVVSWHEHVLHGALQRLAALGLVRDVQGSRARKVAHCVDSALKLGADGIAVLSVLMLRGPVSSGDLLEPASRLHPFADESDVQQTLEKLLNHKPCALVAPLALAEGDSEQRFRHCLAHSEQAPAEAQFLRHNKARRTGRKRSVPPQPETPAAGASTPAAERETKMAQEIEWMQGELLSIREILEAESE